MTTDGVLPYLTLLSAAVLNSMTKSSLREERVCLTYIILVHHGGKPGQELKAGPWRQELKQKAVRNAAYWLASHGLISLFPYTTQDHLPGVGTAHNGLGPRPQSRKCPTGLPEGQSNGGSQLMFPLTRWL